MSDATPYYHRNLPHRHPPGAAIFLICRLYGFLPENELRFVRWHSSISRATGRNAITD